MEFRVLGPLEVSKDGRLLPLGGRQQRAVLAILLLQANQVVSANALINALWGERAPESAANTIQGYVSRAAWPPFDGVAQFLTGSAGHTIHLGHMTLRVVDVRDDDADQPPVLVVEDVADIPPISPSVMAAYGQ